VILSKLILRLLKDVDPERRRKWAATMLELTLYVWMLSHVGLEVLPEKFFKHIMLALSCCAILMTSVDWLSTADVRAES
jgi:hypothetical protein